VTNVDPSMSVVVLEVLSRGELRKFSRPGVARDTDTVRRVWSELAVEISAAPGHVRRIYAEWEPASEDQAFISATFPNVPLTFSFPRPHDGTGNRRFVTLRPRFVRLPSRQPKGSRAEQDGGSSGDDHGAAQQGVEADEA
jgi:hypothetical protein